MKKLHMAAMAAALALLPSLAFSMPTVYPRGTTIYNPEKAWNGYTVITEPDSAYANGGGSYIVDMNGNKVHEWKGFFGFPTKVFPGGLVMGNYTRKGQNLHELAVLDFNGKELWRFENWEKMGDKMSARWHHDYQVSGSPTGYYAPGQIPNPLEGKTLVLSHTNLVNPKVSPNELLDDVIYEVDVKTGKVVWQWKSSDAFDQYGFDDDAKAAIAKRKSKNGVDWMHINSISYVGPNKWWDTDPVKYSAFNPENIIWDGRETNILAITDRKGDIVWKVGPDYNVPELKMIKQIIGQHHCHVIPKGLPGEGNILVFDNGGSAGYGAPTSNDPSGYEVNRREFSRVLEFDPISLDVVWEYSSIATGAFSAESTFFSSYISSAQRLPNGNTMITEGAFSRAFEVTPEKEIVWEHIGPAGTFQAGGPSWHEMYRSYRIPYEWVPQLAKPEEKAVVIPAGWDSRLTYEPELKK